MLPYIFERFYRTTDYEHAGKIGNGLGLAIVKRLVEKHSGTINVESVFGEGTEFTILFPNN